MANKVRITASTGTTHFAIILSTVPSAASSAFCLDITGKKNSKRPTKVSNGFALKIIIRPTMTPANKIIDKIDKNIDLPLITRPPNTL